MSDYISREAIKDTMLRYGFKAPDMTVTEFVEDELPAADVEPVRHGRWIYSKKHLWYKNKNGEIDMWRLDIGFHNGPECQVCHASFCEYCTPNFDDEECDVGHYYCSECKAAQLDNHNTYCPNCGAKMDLEDETNDD
jgi:hypothetical protein